jgi:predicted permease
MRRFGTLHDAAHELHAAAGRREQSMQSDEWWDALRQDLRYAARGLRREPLFTAFVVATLALGIGANAAMFAVVDRLLLKGPEHITEPGRVLRVYQQVRPTGMDEITHSQFGYVTYDLLRHDSTLFDGVAAYNVGQRSTTFGRGADAELLVVGAATSDLFRLLGDRPALGRFFDATEDRTSAPQHVVVLGDGLWRNAFGADRNVVGRSIMLNDESYTIVGVAPKGFTGPQFTKVDAWTPMSLRSANVSHDAKGNSNWTTTWNSQWLRVVVRLKPGVSTERAAATLTATYRHAYAGGDSAIAAAKIRLLPIAYNGQGKETAEAGISRWLVGVAVVVLLIACSNVVNLMLARAVRRRREVAVRLALGAGRARLVRLLLTESLLLAALGGTAGLVVAWVTGQLMRTALLSSIEWTSAPVDARVLGVSAAIALTAGIVVGLVPALRASRPDLTVSLKSGAREGGGAHGARLRAALTVAQAALSLVLLVGAGLFVRSLSNVRALDLGIQPERVWVVTPQWPPLRSSDTAARRIERVRQRDFNVRSLDRARGLPGVERASITVGLPFATSFGQTVRVSGWDSLPALKGGGPNISAVTEDYFETVGTRVLRGRAFTAADRAGSEPVALVNETMAKTLWPGREAIGDCLFTGPGRNDTSICSRIVGIVADARRYNLREEPAMHYYIPLGQERGMCCGVLVIRPRGDATALIPAVRRMMQALDPSISYVSVRTLQESVVPQIRPWRLGASMFGLMGVLALVVAAVGLYSVMSYLVAQRAREIGVRIALGARGGDIVALVLRNSIGMAALGVAIGIALALWAGRFIAPLLFDTSPNDPVVIGGVAAILLAVAVLASVLPAMRAMRVDPMEALRAE